MTPPRTGRYAAGLVLRVVLAAVLALAAGFAMTVAIAMVTPDPRLFLLGGLAVAGLTAALLARWVLPRRPGPERADGPGPGRTARSVIAGSMSAAFVAVVLAALTLLPPLRDPRPPAAEVPGGMATWSVSTGSRIAYVRLPAADAARPRAPVVILHGGPGIPDAAGDVAFFAPLTRLGRDVYVYDQLGAGRSSRLEDPRGYGLDRNVADLEQIRLRIGADRLVLVGYSMGGTLAAHYLARHPDRVERMVLLSPGSLDPADTSGDRASAGLGTRDRLRTYALTLAPRALLGWVLVQVDPAAAHAYFGDAEADARNDRVLTAAEPALHCPSARAPLPVRGSGFYAWQYPQSAGAPTPRDVRPALTGLPTPTLVLKGSCDYLSWRSAITYRHTLPRTTVVHLTGAGHAVRHDRPADVLALTTAFIGGRPLPLPPYVSEAPPPGYRGPA